MFRSKTLEKLLGKIGGGFNSQDNLGNDLTESLTLKRNPANIIRTFDLTVTVDGHVLTYDQAAQSLALKPPPIPPDSVLGTTVYVKTPNIDLLGAIGTSVSVPVPVGRKYTVESQYIYINSLTNGTFNIGIGGVSFSLNFGDDLIVNRFSVFGPGIYSLLHNPFEVVSELIVRDTDFLVHESPRSLVLTLVTPCGIGAGGTATVVSANAIWKLIPMD